MDIALNKSIGDYHHHALMKIATRAMSIGKFGMVVIN